ncbi:hypothetical protein [Vibrio owensii]|uniref:hypothetical protein n=1 Tax=Vibrio harveyi group TaxID=717610 RepID=UPI003CC66A06
MSDEKYTLETILAPGWFDERITDIGTKEQFIKWWNSKIYHKIKEHDFDVVERIITKYEKFVSDQNGYLQLAAIETEFPELYCPEDDMLYVFLPDACGEKAFRLSYFKMNGMIVNHKAFDDRESALRWAAKQGCTEERPGTMDTFVGTEALDRSLVSYKAQQHNMSVDDYVMQTKDRDTRLLFRDRINFLTNLKRQESESSFSM